MITETLHEIIKKHEGGIDDAEKITVTVSKGEMSDDAEGVSALVVVRGADGVSTSFVVGVANGKILSKLSMAASESIAKAAKSAGCEEELKVRTLLSIFGRANHEDN